MNLSLDAGDFRHLVRGGTLVKKSKAGYSPPPPPVRICLQDIGVARMSYEIEVIDRMPSRVRMEKGVGLELIAEPTVQEEADNQAAHAEREKIKQVREQFQREKPSQADLEQAGGVSMPMRDYLAARTAAAPVLVGCGVYGCKKTTQFPSNSIPAAAWYCDDHEPLTDAAEIRILGKQAAALRREVATLKFEAAAGGRNPDSLNPSTLPRCCICCKFKLINTDYVCEDCYGGHQPRPESEGPWPTWVPVEPAEVNAQQIPLGGPEDKP